MSVPPRPLNARNRPALLDSSTVARVQPGFHPGYGAQLGSAAGRNIDRTSARVSGATRIGW
jgi:hypothetical protein